MWGDFASQVFEILVKRFPALGGLIFAAMGVLLIFIGIESAERVNLLRTSQKQSGTVMNVRKTSSIPPRWDADIRTDAGALTRIKVGPAYRDKMQLGATVVVFVPRGVAQYSILPEQRPDGEVYDLHMVEVTWISFAGVVLIVIGVLWAKFGERLVALTEGTSVKNS